MTEEEIYFQGTRDSPLKKQDSAYVVIEFNKCNEETKFEGYPECAPKEEIEAYLETKKIAFKVINEIIDFNDRDTVALAYNE